MRRGWYTWIGIPLFLAVLAVTFLVMQAASAGELLTKVQQITATATNTTGTAVSIVNFAFQPSNVTINVGDSVTWTNNDQSAHTSTSKTDLWDSGTLQNGNTFTFTFNAPGSYGYLCTIHPSMQGSVTVVTDQQETPTPTVTPGITTATATSTTTVTTQPTPSASVTATLNLPPTSTTTSSPTIGGTTPTAIGGPERFFVYLPFVTR